MIVPNTYFKLLLSNDVLLRPVRVVFPEMKRTVISPHFRASAVQDSLCNFAGFHYTFELLNDEGPYPHYVGKT